MPYLVVSCETWTAVPSFLPAVHRKSFLPHCPIHGRPGATKACSFERAQAHSESLCIDCPTSSNSSVTVTGKLREAQRPLQARGPSRSLPGTKPNLSGTHPTPVTFGTARRMVCPMCIAAMVTANAPFLAGVAAGGVAALKLSQARPRPATCASKDLLQDGRPRMTAMRPVPVGNMLPSFKLSEEEEY